MALNYVPAVVPVPGQILSIVLQMSTFGVLCVCFSKYPLSRYGKRRTNRT